MQALTFVAFAAVGSVPYPTQHTLRGDPGVEAFEREGWASAVTQQPFPAGTVVALDAHGGIDAEAAGCLPGEHVLGDGVVEQATAHEVTEHAALHGAREPLDVYTAEAGSLAEAERTVIRLGEQAVNDDDVEVKVCIEGAAEAVRDWMSKWNCLTPGGPGGFQGSDP